MALSFISPEAAIYTRIVSLSPSTRTLYRKEILIYGPHAFNLMSDITFDCLLDLQGHLIEVKSRFPSREKYGERVAFPCLTSPFK
jgi:hypothetical protein